MISFHHEYIRGFLAYFWAFFRSEYSSSNVKRVESLSLNTSIRGRIVAQTNANKSVSERQAEYGCPRNIKTAWRQGSELGDRFAPVPACDLCRFGRIRSFEVPKTVEGAGMKPHH